MTVVGVSTISPTLMVTPALVVGAKHRNAVILDLGGPQGAESVGDPFRNVEEGTAVQTSVRRQLSPPVMALN